MKKLLHFILLSLISFSAFAATSDIVSLKFDMNYKQLASGHTNHYQIKNNIKMPLEEERWMLLMDQKNTPKDILLLSKVEKLNAKEFKLHFMVVDATNHFAIIARPELIVNNGQKAAIAINNKTDALKLTVQATA
jgi:hypothetical protein